jgi:hypothetical protein
LPAVGRHLDHAERGDAVGAHAAQFAVEIGLARGQRRDRLGDLRIFMGAIKPVAGQQPHLASVEPGVHAKAVEFDFVQPLRAVGRGVDALRQLRPDPLRQSSGIAARPARYRPCHAECGRGYCAVACASSK